MGSVCAQYFLREAEKDSQRKVKDVKLVRRWYATSIQPMSKEHVWNEVVFFHLKQVEQAQ